MKARGKIQIQDKLYLFLNEEICHCNTALKFGDNFHDSNIFNELHDNKKIKCNKINKKCRDDYYSVYSNLNDKDKLLKEDQHFMNQKGIHHLHSPCLSSHYSPHYAVCLRNESRTQAILITFSYFIIKEINNKLGDSYHLKWVEEKTFCVTPKSNILFLRLIPYHNNKFIHIENAKSSEEFNIYPQIMFQIEWKLESIFYSEHCIEKTLNHKSNIQFYKFESSLESKSIICAVSMNSGKKTIHTDFDFKNSNDNLYIYYSKNRIILPNFCSTLSLAFQNEMKENLNYSLQISVIENNQNLSNQLEEEHSRLNTDIKLYSNNVKHVNIISSQIYWKELNLMNAQSHIQLLKLNHSFYSNNHNIKSSIYQSPFIGNCWFIAAVHSLLNRRIDLLFNQINIYNNCTEINFSFFKNGKQSNIHVNPLLPTFVPIENLENMENIENIENINNTFTTNQLLIFQSQNAFSACHPQFSMLCLLEKAYAKLHGSYYALNGGWPSTAMFDLIGHPVECLLMNSFSSKDDFLQFLQNALNNKYPICISSNLLSDTFSLKSSHAYSLHNIVHVNQNAFIMIQDPRRSMKIFENKINNDLINSKDHLSNNKDNLSNGMKQFNDINLLNNFNQLNISMDTNGSKSFEEGKIDLFEGKIYSQENIFWIHSDIFYQIVESIHLCYFEDDMNNHFYSFPVVWNNICYSSFIYHINSTATTKVRIGIIQEDENIEHISPFNPVGIDIYKSKLCDKSQISSNSMTIKENDISNYELLTQIPNSKKYISFSKNFQIKENETILLLPTVGYFDKFFDNQSKIFIRSSHPIHIKSLSSKLYLDQLKSQAYIANETFTKGIPVSIKNVFYQGSIVGQVIIYELKSVCSISIAAKFKLYPNENESTPEHAFNTFQRISNSFQEYQSNNNRIQNIFNKSSSTSSSLLLLIRPKVECTNIRIKFAPTQASLKHEQIELLFNGRMTMEDAYQFSFNYVFKLISV